VDVPKAAALSDLISWQRPLVASSVWVFQRQQPLVSSSFGSGP
jgi:hypothetical protein